MDAFVVETEDRAQGFDQPGLGQARHADQQRMAAAQKGDQGLFDHLALPEDDLADAVANQTEAAAQSFDLGSEIGGGGVDG